MHWATCYIGMPYKAGGRGPVEIDCWGLVQLAYRQHFHIELPDYPGCNPAVDPVKTYNTIKEGLAAEWVEIEKPFDGCLVAMSHRTEMHHVGLWIDVDGGRILHNLEGRSVVADSTNPKLWRMRGIRILKYYRYGLRH